MNPMTNVKNVQRMNQLELNKGLAGSKTSWHEQYKDSAWIFVGGLPYDLTEGDVLCVFSQYGEIVNINLVRDKTTGKPKGFCFICYEDQRSTILAVDNLNSVKVLNRTLRVDHVQDYKKPKETGEEDELTKMLREEGCGPKLEIPVAPGQAEEPEEEVEEMVVSAKKPKKEKKKKKKKEKKKKKKEKKKKQDSEESASSGSEVSDSDINSDSHKVPSVRIKKETDFSEYSDKERTPDSDPSPQTQRHSVKVKEERKSSDRPPDNRSELHRRYQNERDSQERVGDRYDERTRGRDNYSGERDHERYQNENSSRERSRDRFNDRGRGRENYNNKRERDPVRYNYTDRERERPSYRGRDRSPYRSHDRSRDRREADHYKDGARGSGRGGYRQNGGYRR